MCGAVAFLDKVQPSTPLALGMAAALAFPDDWAAVGLRREAARLMAGPARRFGP